MSWTGTLNRAARGSAFVFGVTAIGCVTGGSSEDGFTSVAEGDDESASATSAETEETGASTGTTLDGETSGETGDCEDKDGDGWTTCDGDCCDGEGSICTGDTSLVNPGAFDVPGNNVDDDCNGTVDDVVTACDADLDSDSSEALDYARALDLCSVVEEDPSDPLERRWGVISASITMTDGSSAPHAEGHSIRPDFGPSFTPSGGSSMVVLSSGAAADGTDTAPDFVVPQNGLNAGTGSGISAPADWLSANGGSFPNPLGCPAPTSTDANDAQMLTLRVRTPTNAKSFSVRMNFFSAEYPEWVCSEYNDFFVALIDSESDANPADKNLATYDDGDELYPVGVNLVESADGIFSVCQNEATGCRAAALEGNYASCTDFDALQGTGFELEDGVCPTGAQGPNGGGTGWLQLVGNVEGGEVMTLRLAIWDTSGHLFDSTVLLDDWQWSLDAADAGVYIP